MTKFKPVEEIFWVDNLFTDGDQSGGRVVALADGGFVICWTDAGDHGDGSGACVRAQVYGADGKPSGEELLIGGADEFDRFDPSISATAGGGFVVSWTVGASAKPDFPSWIEAQAFDGHGAAIGRDVIVTERIGAGDSTVTALSGGRFLVGWTDPSNDHGDVIGAIFSERGRGQGALHLSDHADGLQTSAATAQLAGGGFVAVWTNASDGDQDDDGSSIQGALFGAKGEPLGESFQINVDTKFDQACAHVAATGHGFVVVWADHGVSWEGAIHARFFDEGGKALTDDVTIARGIPDADLAPMIAVNADGQVLIACAVSGTVFAELFDANGNSLGDLYQAAAPEGSDRSDVSLAALPSGEFVLTWTEHDPRSGDGSGTSVQAQIIAIGDEQAGRDDKFEIQEDGRLQVHWKELFENDGLSPPGAITLDHVDGVTHGTVKVDDQGFIYFTPDADFNGTASFTYHLTGEGGFTDTAIVHIEVTPVDDAPVALDDACGAVEDMVVTGSVAANDFDVDSVGLHYTLAAPVAGLVLADDGSFTFDAGDAAYQHLAAGETGQVTATYQVVDDDGASATATLTFTLSGANDAPATFAFAPVQLGENAAGGTAAGSVTAVDIDGDALAYSLKDDAGHRFTIDGASGAITVADGAVLDYERNHYFRLVVDVSDGHGGLIEQAVVVRLTDMAETISGDDGANMLRAPTGGDWRLEGLGGNDALVDGRGLVTLAGGTGSDTYYVHNAATAIVEAAGEGTDTVVTNLAGYVLGDNLENLRTTGTGAFTGTGNDLANLIRGYLGDDVLSGGGNDDQLQGGSGGDTLNGDAGSDLLVGGAGADVLTGGADADRFRFLSLSDSDADTGSDRITDFSQADHDRIDLSRIDGIKGVAGSRFTFIGDAAFDGHAGQLRFEQIDGRTVVSGDVDGDGLADLTITLDGTHPLTGGDFVL